MDIYQNRDPSEPRREDRLVLEIEDPKLSPGKAINIYLFDLIHSDCGNPHFMVYHQSREAHPVNQDDARVDPRSVILSVMTKVDSLVTRPV